VPDFRTSASNGVEFSSTYYARLANNRDLAVTGTVFTKANPMAKVHYRELDDKGAFQITGYITRSAATDVSGTNTRQKWRGYFDANGKYQLSTNWSLDFSGRFASDRTFLRRYYISSDDTLRSTINLERIGEKSYFSISGWAFQNLRATGTQGAVPVALPMIDYRRRFNENLLGGKIEVRANSLAITRSAGQDMQRAFTSVEWNLRKMTPMGQVITLTALGRGDVYHSSDNYLTSTAIYRGNPDGRAAHRPRRPLTSHGPWWVRPLAARRF
jgi:LPS-assembly protein